MTTFSIRYETSNSHRLVGIVNHAPTAGDALEVWALVNDLKIKVEVEFKDARPTQARAYASIKGGRTGRLIAYARGDAPMVAGEIEKKYPGPRNKNPYPKVTIPIWHEGARRSSWTNNDDRIEQWPAGDLAHKPLVDYRIDFPGDDFHRPGEPDIVDIPRNPAGLTTVEAEYDRAMIEEGKHELAEVSKGNVGVTDRVGGKPDLDAEGNEVCHRCGVEVPTEDDQYEWTDQKDKKRIVCGECFDNLYYGGDDLDEDDDEDEYVGSEDFKLERAFPAWAAKTLRERYARKYAAMSEDDQAAWTEAAAELEAIVYRMVEIADGDSVHILHLAACTPLDGEGMDQLTSELEA